jgi:hypothetical protein
METNITVPYVPISEFDWGLNLQSVAPLPWNQIVWYEWVVHFIALHYSSHFSQYADLEEKGL